MANEPGIHREAGRHAARASTIRRSAPSFLPLLLALATAPCIAPEAVPATFTEWSHTVTAGSDRLLIVGVSITNSVTISSVTYGGIGLTRIGARGGERRKRHQRGRCRLELGGTRRDL